MDLLQRAGRACLRKPARSLLLMLIVWVISLLFLAGLASRAASVTATDSTRQAIGVGFLLMANEENRSQRVDAASQKIAALFPDGQGSYGGYHAEKITVNGMESWHVWTDHAFETLQMEDIQKIAAAQGIADYNVTTAPTAVKPENFTRIEDPQTDQTYDAQGVALVGSRTMALDSNVLSGNLTIQAGRMITQQDTDACVISAQLAEKNQLQVGDVLGFYALEGDGQVRQATVVGIYQVKEEMQPYMSGDTFRSENVIFTDLQFPEKVEQKGPLYERAYFQVADVDQYEQVKAAIQGVEIGWARYDLIDNKGSLDTMAANFSNLETISSLLLGLVAGAGFCILCLVFVFWIRGRTHEIAILLSLGISKGKVLLQIFSEALLLSTLAVALSFLLAPAASHAAADYLVGQQAAQAQAQQDLDEGKVATDYQAPALTVTGVETALTAPMLLADALGVGGLLLLSTAAAGILILGKNPKDMLADMS